MLKVEEITAAAPVDALPDAARDQLATVVDPVLDSVTPALALTVIHRGEVLLNRVWGWIDPDTRQIAATPDTRFDLASVTKMFTTTAFLAQVSEGKVGLDDPLASVVPEFAASGARPVEGGQDPHSRSRLPVEDGYEGREIDPRSVTFRQLLTHTSGLAPWRDVYNAAGAAPVAPGGSEPVARAERWRRALEAVCRYPFVGVPGDRIRYSDLGLMLLGESVARLDGKPGRLDEVIAARVTQPLNLQTVMFNPLQHGVAREKIAPTEDDPNWRRRRVWGEVHDENACGLGGVAGHAGLFGAARDIAAFGQAWLAHDSRLGIAPALMDEAVCPHVETDGIRRGLGWLLVAREDSSAGDRFSPNAFGHTGFTGTSLWIDPERRLVVACLTNSVYPGRLLPGTHEFRRTVHTALADIADAR